MGIVLQHIGSFATNFGGFFAPNASVSHIVLSTSPLGPNGYLVPSGINNPLCPAVASSITNNPYPVLVLYSEKHFTAQLTLAIIILSNVSSDMYLS